MSRLSENQVCHTLTHSVDIRSPLEGVGFRLAAGAGRREQSLRIPLGRPWPARWVAVSVGTEWSRLAHVTL